MENIDEQFDLQLYHMSTTEKKEAMKKAMYIQLYPFVYRLAYNLVGNAMEAEDIAQEVFIAALKGLTKFRGESKLSTWLYRITARIAGRHLARKPNHQPLNAEVENLPNREQADADVINEELVQAIAKLSLSQRTVLSLVVIEGLSHQATAEVLGVPIGTIWSRLHSARKQLATNLKI